MNPSEFVARLSHIVGEAHLFTAESDTAPFLTDWRKLYTGRAIAVAKPASTAEVVAIVELCASTGTPIVPQGGNTGLVGGATPDESGRALVVSTARMNRIRAVDPLNNTITAEAGCVLASLQQAAHDAGRLFPLSLAAEGSCTIGGNLSTNAGGTAVLRYGNARELCLGVEAVTASGAVIGLKNNGDLNGLRKDNTGYDLRDLMIGAEGTLGIITAAVMKLYPLPRAQLAALAAVPSPGAALQLLALAQEHCGAALTAFELIGDFAMTLVEKHVPRLKSPFAERHPFTVLIEVSDYDEAHADTLIEGLIEKAFEHGWVVDAVISRSIAQSRQLWALREEISEAQAAEGKNIKHDISLPISRIAEFIETTDAKLQQTFPGVRIVDFGHLGDGNLHYNVSGAAGESHEQLFAKQAAIHRIVYDSVTDHGGSISAEHGLGQLKREEIRHYKPAADLELMRVIKNALDPQNIMNPGKVL